MYVVANKTKVPLKEVDEKEGWLLNLGFTEVEVSPWILTGAITLVLLILVLIFWSLSAVDTKPPTPSAPMPTPAVGAAVKAAPKLKGGAAKGKMKKARK